MRLVSARSLSAETRPTVHQHLRCGTRPLAPKATAQRTGATGQAGTGAQDLQVQVKEFSTYIEFVGEAPSPIYHIRLAMCAGTRNRFVCCGASKPISGCSQGYGSHFRASPTRTYMNSQTRRSLIAPCPPLPRLHTLERSGAFASRFGCVLQRNEATMRKSSSR